MSEGRRSDGWIRARPVADAPVQALLERVDELARRWAIALIIERPLAEMAEVPLEDLAREAPSVCAQVVRALDSDGELERIAASEGSRGRGGAAPAVRLGALDARAIVEHIEALRGVLWEAVLGELEDPTVRQVADLSDRLASVCATLLAAALGEGVTAMGTGVGTHEPPPQPAAAPRGQVLYTAPQATPGRGGAALIDEFEPATARPEAGRREGEQPARASGASAQEPVAEGPQAAAGAGGTSRTSPRPLPWDTPLQPPGSERRTDARGAAAGPVDEGDSVVRITRGRGAPSHRR